MTRRSQSTAPHFADNPITLVKLDVKTLIVAAGPRAAAETFARSWRPRSRVVSRDEFGFSPRRFRRLLKGDGAKELALHTPNWERQLNPQLYELLLALAPAQDRFLADDATGTVRKLSPLEVAARVARIPGAVAGGLTAVGLEAMRFIVSSNRRSSPPYGPLNLRPAILAIWFGDSGGTVGGSITHISGILRGFRQAGFRIGLVTMDPPPPQLSTVIDDLELAEPLPPRARLTSDVECVLVNQAVRRAASRLARRLEPGIVYQRHRAFLVAGADAARSSGALFVLEWNASEAWTRENWLEALPIERVFDPLLTAMERHIAAAADLLVAVSGPAAESARERGAVEPRIVVVPNGVDIEAVDAFVAPFESSPLTSTRIGWIGTFGPWHGAEVLIQALALLDPDVELLLIGDGALRPDCELLAVELGVAERIEWTGSLPHANAVAQLGECDVLASPHTPLPGQEFFGSPTKIFEYMAIGRPIVASALGQIAEVLEDGRTAKLVTPGDPEALAAGIAEVLHLPDCGRALGDAAQREARERHTWAQRARTIVEHLENVNAAREFTRDGRFTDRT
jgi:glycosyltransferase involved in cell wall biosynthesis